MQAPPSRDAPPPPGTQGSIRGFDSAIAELKAALARDPEGFTSNAAAKAILGKLNDEIARAYGDDEGDDEDEGSEYDDDESGSEEEEEDDEYDDEEDSGGGGGGARVDEPKGPRPIDLWRAAHEVERPAKKKLVLSGEEWMSLVNRLNESSKKKQGFLMRAQHQQIAAELAGFTFVPHISDKSRELAAQNKALPLRVEALMRKKKAKLDKIRHDKTEEELREATFKPNLAATQHARANKMAEGRRVGHLMQYDADKRSRATQRRHLISEMENRDLTFNPAINKNSIRIVERLNLERQAALMHGDGHDDTPLPSSRIAAAKKALNAALAAGLSLQSAARESGLPVPDAKTLRTLGRSYLPGHEEETFHPKINARSVALASGGAEEASEGVNVYARLYKAVTAVRASKIRDAVSGGARSRSPRGGARGVGPLRDGGAGSGGEAAGGDRGDASAADAENPPPGHPQFWNKVAFDVSGAGRMDFILRRLLPPERLIDAAHKAAAAGIVASASAAIDTA